MAKKQTEQVEAVPEQTPEKVNKSAIIRELSASGMSVADIAEEMEKRGIPTSKPTIYTVLNAAKKGSGKTSKATTGKGLTADDMIEFLTIAKKIGVDEAKTILNSLK